MMDGQKVPALFAALLGEGVTPGQIEAAVAAVGDLQLGQSLSSLADPRYPEQMVRSFTFEQAALLERAS